MINHGVLRQPAGAGLEIKPFSILGTYTGDFFILNMYLEKTATPAIIRARGGDNFFIFVTIGFKWY